MIDFLTLSFIDILDIILVALLIFWIIRIVKGTSAMYIFFGIITLYVAWIVIRALNMKLLSFLMGQVLGVGVIALIVVFQPEIRRFLLRFGTTYANTSDSVMKKIFNRQNNSGMSVAKIEEIVGACKKMSESKTGALIIMVHTTQLDSIIESGDKINADINRRLITNIFFKNAPLHDGAMVMNKDRIVAARCTLPISDNPDIPARFGMRHRAGIGVTEITDADAIIVSEETGGISYAHNGKLKEMNSLQELKLEIENSYR